MGKGPKGKSPKVGAYHVDRILVKPKRKKLNAAQKKELKAEAIRLFVTKVGRKAQKGVEPNDRKHSTDVERAASQLKPAEFDSLLRGEDDDA